MSDTFDFVRRFGPGINLGNSLDAPDGETAWGNPPISRELIRLYRKEGFRTIRLPVTWDKHTDVLGIVNPGFMNRVREVVEWCLDEGFITILNLHHEGSWLSPSFNDSVLRRFSCLWTQIASQFADCAERLVFEAFNEIRNGDDWQGTHEAFYAVNQLAATFIETIRSAGGNNSGRYLMIPTYAASDAELACINWRRAVNDERLIATVHCYNPHEFTHQLEGMKDYHPAWCKPALEAVFDRLKRVFLDCGVPVVIGEAGVMQKDGCPTEEGRIAWANDLGNLASQHGIPVIVWEDGGMFRLVDRHLVRWVCPQLVESYRNSVIPTDKCDANLQKRHIRGINLSGWLVLERWMSESLFSGVKGKDETCFCVQLGREVASRRLREHWDTWISEADFAWIADHGFNAVRIPVGHWIFGAASGYPYHERYGVNPHPYVDGGIERLDHAFDWAEKNGLMVLVDLHCAPGSQNGFDNGGLEGVCDWWKNPEYLDFTILTLERLAERYGKCRALWGIETLNEPHWDIPDEVLLYFNHRAYDAIRKHCLPENGAVVLHDGFRGLRIKDVFGGQFREPKFSNVVLDTHQYQCFDARLKKFDAWENIQYSKCGLTENLRGFQNIYWTIVGEWSLATGSQRNATELQEFFEAQNEAFKHTLGSFFRSYKTEDGNPAWSLRHAVEYGLRL